MSDLSVSRLSADGMRAAVPALAELLVDAVEDGASVGFLAPGDRQIALAWWEGLVPAVAEGRYVVWVATLGGQVRGTVQLRWAGLPNAWHRAEVAKLLVHRAARGRGVGRALLAVAEDAALDVGATVLVLDTKTGSAADTLYRSAGWTEVGVIPDSAADPDGTLCACTFFNKAWRRVIREGGSARSTHRTATATQGRTAVAIARRRALRPAVVTSNHASTTGTAAVAAAPLDCTGLPRAAWDRRRGGRTALPRREPPVIRDCTAADVARLEESMPTRGTGHCAYLVAVDGEQAVGSGVLRWTGGRADEVREAFPGVPVISNLGVREDHRNRGVGTALIGAAEQHAAARGYPLIGICVGADNPAASRLYLRLGYENTRLRYESRYDLPDENGVLREIVEHDIFLRKRPAAPPATR